MRATSIWTMCAACLIFTQACSESGSERAEVAPKNQEHTEIVKRDLFAIISLQGEECRRVIQYEHQADLDYMATCENGNRYRIHVSPEGNVHVNTHDGSELIP